MTRTRRLGAVLFQGFELLDYYGPLEMFGCLGDELEILVLAETDAPVASSAGPATAPDATFAAAPQCDLYLVPGGLGVLGQQDNPAMLEFLQKASEGAERFMTVCNGAAIAASAGLLDGRRATTNKIFFDTVTPRGDAVKWIESARWVEDGPFYTASGVSAGIDMALSVIAGLYGEARAEAVAILTEYTWQRDPNLDPFAKHLNDKQWMAKAAGKAAGNAAGQAQE